MPKTFTVYYAVQISVTVTAGAKCLFAFIGKCCQAGFWGKNAFIFGSIPRRSALDAYVREIVRTWCWACCWAGASRAAVFLATAFSSPLDGYFVFLFGYIHRSWLWASTIWTVRCVVVLYAHSGHNTSAVHPWGAISHFLSGTGLWFGISRPQAIWGYPYVEWCRPLPAFFSLVFAVKWQ